MKALSASHDEASTNLARPAAGQGSVDGGTPNPARRDVSLGATLSSSERSPGGFLPAPQGYRVAGRLSEGGTGVVWGAFQYGTRRPVVLKLMSAAGLGSERARLRF